jgi:DnaJ-class molecular chaperone
MKIDEIYSGIRAYESEIADLESKIEELKEHICPQCDGQGDIECYSDESNQKTCPTCHGGKTV